MNKFKKGDTVFVISGRDKSKQSKISAVFPSSKSVIVDDLNQQTHYVRKTQESEGGLVKRAGRLNWSKIMVVCPSCKKPSRTAIKKIDGGQSARHCKRCGSSVDK